MAKVGRKRSGAYETSWGEVLTNWRKPKSANYLIPIGRDRPRYSLSDERLAVNKAKRWDAANSGEMFDAKHWREVLKMSDKERQTWLSNSRIRAESLPESERLDDISGIQATIDGERERIRTLILTDPKQASVELRIPHLADYPTVSVTWKKFSALIETRLVDC